MSAPILTASQMRALDARTIGGLGIPGLLLMERAALGVVAALAGRPRGKVVVLCGPGNNGGDGWAVARLLHFGGWSVRVATTVAPEQLAGDARVMCDAAIRAGVPQVDAGGVRDAVAAADVVIDALLGIGTTEAPRGAVAAMIDDVRTSASVGSRPLVVAIDVPSGVDSDTGAVLGPVIEADITVACAARKWAHVLPGAVDACGDVLIADIGIPPAWLASSDAAAMTWGLEAARGAYRAYRRGEHKGTRGHVLVVAGSEAMPGAAALAARAALVAGAGLVSLAAPRSVRELAIRRSPELIGVDCAEVTHGVGERYDAVLLGPGLGVDARASGLLRAVLATIGDRRLVLDADALTLLAHHGPGPLPPGAVLTPHPGELARLIGTTTAEVIANLPASARQARARWQATVVAKTAGAVIVGESVSFVDAGHPGMASGGMGDVLSGVIASCALHHPPFEAACLGAWLHAAAGRVAGAQLGAEALTASAVIDALPAAFAQLAPVRP